VTHDVGVAELLGVPEGARMRERLTKKLLAAQFADTSPADAKLIDRAVASAQVVAMLRPETMQVPAHYGDDRNVVDIAVLEVTLAEKVSGTDCSRIADLLHRSMPRPVVVLIRTRDGGGGVLSLALSRPSKTEPEHSTIEAAVRVPLNDIVPGTLCLSRLNRTDVWTLYRDLVRVAAAGGRPGSTAMTAEEAVTLRRQLIDLEAELAAVVRDAKREKNQQRRIDYNTRGRDLRTQVERVRGSLYSADIDPTDTGGEQ
jgi:hypothetical protein